MIDVVIMELPWHRWLPAAYWFYLRFET
jgi:hypothetical protein